MQKCSLSSHIFLQLVTSKNHFLEHVSVSYIMTLYRCYNKIKVTQDALSQYNINYLYLS